MDIEKLDKESREMLAYLNTHSDLSAATLAEIFNQHYNLRLLDALETLSHLENKSMIKLKTNKDKSAVMIQITHLGRTYEREYAEQEKQKRKKALSDRIWNIVTLVLSAIITIILNLILEG